MTLRDRSGPLRSGGEAATIARIATALLIVAATSSREALAEPTQPERPGFELTWESPEGCGSRGELVDELTLVLGAAPASLAQRTLVARGIVHVAAPEQYALTLELLQDGAVHTRVLAAPTCGELVRAAAVVIAMALRSGDAEPTNPVPEQTGSTPQPLPSCEPTERPCPRCSPPVPVALIASRRAPAPSRAADLTAGLAAIVSLGVLPETAFGGGVELAAERGPVHLELRVTHAASVARLPEGRAGALLSQDEARLGACWLWGRRWALGPCLAGHAGWIGGRGLGVDHPRRTHEPWASLSSGLLLSWRRRGARLAFGLEALVPLVRPGLTLDGVLLPRPAPVGGSAALGLGLGFP